MRDMYGFERPQTLVEIDHGPQQQMSVHALDVGQVCSPICPMLQMNTVNIKVMVNKFTRVVSDCLHWWLCGISIFPVPSQLKVLCDLVVEVDQQTKGSQ